MDEMTQVRQFRADVPALDPADLADARHRLLRETQGTPRHGQLLGGLLRNETTAAPGKRRVAWRWRLAGGLAIVVAAGFVVTQQIATPPVSTENGPVAGASSEAVEVLYRAADYAAATPDQAVRDDQFVYVESKTMYLATLLDRSRQRSYLYRTHRKIWKSVDGSQPAWLWVKGLPPVALSGQPLPPEVRNDTKGGWEKTPIGGRREPGYASELPTDPDKMYDYLYQGVDDVGAWIKVGELIQERMLPPKARAAMFRAAARIPGATVVKGAVDAAGRRGVAVAYTHHGVSQQLIFDTKTYQYLGERAVVVDEQQTRPRLDVPKGTVVASTAELRCVLVDEPGQQR